MRREKFLAAGFSVAIAVATAGGCATMKSSAPAAPAKEANAPAAATAAAKAATPPQAKQTQYEPPVLSGKILETMNVGNYTYMQLEQDGRKGWAAVPVTEVKVGETVTLIPGIDMVDFYSQMLKRTFGNIHFSAGIQGAEQKQPKEEAKAAVAAAADANAKLPASHPALPKGAVEAAMAAQGKPVLSGKVVESLEAGGYTYICFEKDGNKTWAAIPATEVKVGSEVTIQEGNVMPFFASKSLKRNFQNIIFSPGLAK